jgi:hypothetical protein
MFADERTLDGQHPARYRVGEWQGRARAVDGLDRWPRVTYCAVRGWDNVWSWKKRTHPHGRLGPDLTQLGHRCIAGSQRLVDHLIGAREHGRRQVEAECLGVLRLSTSSTFVDCWTGREENPSCVLTEKGSHRRTKIASFRVRHLGSDSHL